ncbi:MAG: glycine oxidase ThiO [Gemmatimonadota bacterium]
MTATHDVVIVGGGAVGAACAWELARSGRSVLVVERGGDTGQAWKAAAGMLAPQIEADPEDPLLDLGLASRERYRDLSAALKELTGIDIGFWQGGIVRVAQDEHELNELRARVAWQRQQGHLADWLGPDETHERWPWLGKTLGALWAPREGALDPVRLVEACLEGARRHGATVVQDTVIALERSGDRVVAAVGTGGRYAGGHVVLAAGAWSGRLDGLPRPVSVEPVRGQMAALPWPAGIAPAIVYTRRHYLVWKAGEAITGSTMEYAGYNATTTPEAIDAMLDRAVAICPSLDRSACRRTWAGLRPGTPDGRPIIGREPEVAGLIYATGHGRNGILLAAITGEIVRRLVDGEANEDMAAEFDLAAVAPERFWRLEGRAFPPLPLGPLTSKLFP